MYINKEKKNRIMLIGGSILLFVGLLFPLLGQRSWFYIFDKIKDAIFVGDSGHLILAGAYMCLLYALQNTAIFLGAILLMYYTAIRDVFSELKISFISFGIIILIHIIDSILFKMPWEPIPTVLALVTVIFIFEKLLWEGNNFIQIAIISIQVFFAFQWLNVMPIFSPYFMGRSDASFSIKQASIYLEATSVLNFTGAAFFLPFIFSATITTILFISFSQNIRMMGDNYNKEAEIQNMKRKIMEDGIYMEVKSLVHDLKTPLVTIRGLNSLLALSRDETKIGEYCDRIDNSVEKMNEMISSFLYETSRQRMGGQELINYIRAQFPVEDEQIKIDMQISSRLPEIYVNKIRIARAVINVLENAIIVPHTNKHKYILFQAYPVKGGMEIVISDNGIGISTEDLPRVWEIGFSKNNTSGLGLPFAKQIIEGNGGRIGMLSELNNGTKVTIFIPSVEVQLE